MRKKFLYSKRQVQKAVKIWAKDKGVRYTEQAFSSIVQSVMRTPTEVAGDSDSTLLGLLCSGSYTVDLLELAGADPRLVRRLAEKSTQNAFSANVSFDDALNYADSALGVAIEKALTTGKPLEASDLLSAALDPSVAYRKIEWSFFHDLRRDKPASGSLLRSLENGVFELIALSTGILSDDAPKDLRYRKQAITSDEDFALDKAFGVDYKGMSIPQLEFIIAALNAWYTQRRILIEPVDVCMGAIDKCMGLMYAPSQFSEAGGNIKIVDGGLWTASQFAAERDSIQTCLFERDGRIHVGQYTYRGSLFAQKNDQYFESSYPVSIQAIGPLPIVSSSVLGQFSELISKKILRELEIQNFLDLHPEFLEIIGYCNVLPHVCLREDSVDDRSKMIPDYVLQLPGNRGFDILDLKLPSEPLVVRQRYPTMSYQLTRAIGQLRAYRKFFDSPSNRKQFLKDYGLQAFRPEVIVVIGRSSAFRNLDERRDIEEQMSGVKLYTYDDVIAYARTRKIQL